MRPPRREERRTDQKNHLPRGLKDPWIVPAKLAKLLRIVEGMPEARYTVVRVAEAGHCPHDDAPEPVNAALVDFAQPVD